MTTETEETKEDEEQRKAQANQTLWKNLTWKQSQYGNTTKKQKGT